MAELEMMECNLIEKYTMINRVFNNYLKISTGWNENNDKIMDLYKRLCEKYEFALNKMFELRGIIRRNEEIAIENNYNQWVARAEMAELPF